MEEENRKKRKHCPKCEAKLATDDKNDTLNDETVVNVTNKSHLEEATEEQNTIQKPVEMKARLNNLAQTDLPSAVSSSNNFGIDNGGGFPLNESELKRMAQSGGVL